MLLAVNLAVLRYLAWPALDFTALHLALSIVPMLNVLAIVSYRLLRNPQARRPFATGLFVFGLMAMLTHASCVKLCPEQLKSTYIAPIGPSFQLCRAYGLPGCVGVSSEGYSCFRFYPALILLNFSAPQFPAAGLGGYGSFLLARLTRQKATAIAAGTTAESPARQAG
jgi:hypothetical protein